MVSRVSVVTPLYNCEAFLERFLDALLHQTHNDIEVVLVDDGSTDSTPAIASRFQAFFEAKSIRYIFVQQENGGVSSAINKGLGFVTGQYICWPDPDDVFESNALKRRADFLDRNLDFGLLRSDGFRFSVKSASQKLKRVSGGNLNRFNGSIFEDLLLSRTFITPCAYMIRADLLWEIYPNREIVPSRYGQNYQILLPMTFSHKCGYVDYPDWTRFERPDSHSRASIGKFGAEYDRLIGVERLIFQILNFSLQEAANDYLPLVRRKYLRGRLKCAYRHRKRNLAARNFLALLSTGSISARDCVHLAFTFFPFLTLLRSIRQQRLDD